MKKILSIACLVISPLSVTTVLANSQTDYEDLYGGQEEQEMNDFIESVMDRREEQAEQESVRNMQ